MKEIKVSVSAIDYVKWTGVLVAWQLFKWTIFYALFLFFSDYDYVVSIGWSFITLLSYDGLRRVFMRVQQLAYSDAVDKALEGVFDDED
ncbi:hypothetical protein [Mammaliicoccus sciuri]|uniref:hypothetical protein n=1 Tax=Mammaliicoccus sciuri TaxID=1296 RepID=UPI000D1F9CCF|nr:hypothetical protein [Mammaliicoccus sciuri]PTJ54215.1 hypothetical protein BU012_01055 [Mammaliicoccus sciuri]